MSGHYEAIAIWHCVSLMRRRSPKTRPQIYRTCSKQGYRRAQRILGCMYYEGEVVDKDLSAIRWERAADQLDEHDVLLGTSYYFGEGVDHDADKAFELFNSASDFWLPRGRPQAWHLLFLWRRLRGRQRKSFEYFSTLIITVSFQFLAGNCYFNGYGCERL